ncbi:MAG: adenylosuccinate lyase [Bacteroidota bacterium]|nr:adenylosuccinate lyase [Bacteroidota bacterium]
MNLTALTAISPVDGRYRSKTKELANYFSEWALIRYRLQIEVEYFIALCELPLPQLSSFPKKKVSALRSVYLSFGPENALRIKEIESITNHDVKAVEYYLKEHFEKLGLSSFKEFIHFGLTSQDINNTATPLSLKEGIEQAYLPLLEKLITSLSQSGKTWNDIPMLARTHGQPASPTRLGKEIGVFADRLKKQVDILKALPYPAKFGGATGNFNAHFVAYPEIDWVAFANKLVNDSLGLERSQVTTQIEHYDNLAAIFDCLRRIQVILIDFSRDMWTYISMNYFKQKIKKGEVGSSAMPHKVNPIDFENAEGNLGISNALLNHLSNKLPVSRLQRDLTDSTVLRNIGVPLAHGIISISSLSRGIKKLMLNKEAITEDLNNNWNVIAEALQTILRREQYPNPYETLLELTRKNKAISQESLNTFIGDLNVSEKVKEEMREITPFTYTGIDTDK